MTKSEIMKLLDDIITVEDGYGDYTDRDNLTFVINNAIEIKEMLEMEQ